MAALLARYQKALDKIGTWRLLALPCAPGAAPENVRKITLDGREYWLFRT